MLLYFLHSSCGQSSQNTVLLWTAGKNPAYCTQAASLLLWVLLSYPLVFSTGHRHPKQFSTSPHFPPSPYAQPFIPTPALSCWLCVPGNGLNPITEMIKAEGNSISGGYLCSWWLQQCSQQHSPLIQSPCSAWQRKWLWLGRDLPDGFALQKTKFCGAAPAWQGPVKGASV